MDLETPLKKQYAKKPKFVLVEDVLYYKRLYETEMKAHRDSVFRLQSHSIELSSLRAKKSGLIETIKALSEANKTLATMVGI